MSRKMAVLLAEGFEEIEAVIPIDVLRRLEFEVVTVSLGGKVSGSHGIIFDPDCLIDALDAAALDAVILPGGLPGAENLKNSPQVINLVREMYNAGKIVAAICAAPIALAQAGIMKGKTCTGYPMALVKDALADANYTAEKVEHDGNVITGKGPGAAFDFAVEIAIAMGKESQARQLMKSMFVK